MDKSEQKLPFYKTFFLDDSGNNKLHLKTTLRTKVLHLQLQSEGNRKRKIGVITRSTRTLVIRRNRDKHLFIKCNAYGFNDYVLRNTKSFDNISLSDEYASWKIPVKFILENGKHLNFKQQGFEKQIFVSLEEIEQFKKHESERI